MNNKDYALSVFGDGDKRTRDYVYNHPDIMLNKHDYDILKQLKYRWLDMLKRVDDSNLKYVLHKLESDCDRFDSMGIIFKGDNLIVPFTVKRVKDALKSNIDSLKDYLKLFNDYLNHTFDKVNPSFKYDFGIHCNFHNYFKKW